MGWRPEGREGRWKGQWGAVSDQILPAPGGEQRPGVYKTGGMKGMSLQMLYRSTLLFTVRQ